MIHTFERNPCQPNTIEHCSFAGTTLPTWPAICTFCHNQLLQMHWPSQATNQLIKEAMKKGVILNITFEMFEEAGTAQAASNALLTGLLLDTTQENAKIKETVSLLLLKGIL